MTGIRLSALAGSTSEAFIRRIPCPTARLIATPDHRSGHSAAVIDGKVDAMVADLPVCAWSAVLRHPDAGSDHP